MSRAANAFDAPFAARARLLGGMGVAAVALGALVYATVLRRLDEKPDLVQRERIFKLSVEGVSQLEIRYRRKEFRLVREGNGWRIEDSSGSAPVPDDRVQGFLRGLKDLVRLVPIGTGSELSLAEFGLDPPRGEVILMGTREGDIRLLLGNRNAPLTGIYIEVMPDGEVALVGAVLLLEVERLAALASEGAVDAREKSTERKGA